MAEPVAVVFQSEDPIYTTYTSPPRLEFDGHQFDWAWSSLYLPVLYLASKARRGDEQAVDVLKAFNCTVLDRDGKRYWPVD